MGQLVSQLEATVSELERKPHHGIGGLVHEIADRHKLDNARSQLDSARAELDNRYRSVAEGIDQATGVSEADALIRKVTDLQVQLRDTTKRKETLASDRDRISGETKRREDLVASLGFDALAVEADLLAHGASSIQTNLVLKRNEMAVASAAATLCRFRTKTQYVGASQGVSIPLGHGFRYRVSGFKGHPVQTESLVDVDAGSLVVTNQRLAFLGAKRDISVPLEKLLHVEPFADAIAIGREGKESRDVFRLQQPARLLLFLNWALGHE